VLHEAVSASSGDITQIIFQRNANIRTADLLELIDKVRRPAYGMAGVIPAAVANGQCMPCCIMRQVGWPKRSMSKLETALQGSYLVSTIVRRECSTDGTLLRERLIGLIRCTSDRVFNATIWDVLVDPSYQVGAAACPRPCRAGGVHNTVWCLAGRGRAWGATWW
jgi:hypothetical protein